MTSTHGGPHSCVDYLDVVGENAEESGNVQVKDPDVLLEEGVGLFDQLASFLHARNAKVDVSPIEMTKPAFSKDMFRSAQPFSIQRGRFPH